MTSAAGLDVRCPICDAAPGQPCEDVDGGYVVDQLVAHVYRITVAAEEKQASG